MEHKTYHQLPLQELFNSLQTSTAGLSEKEVALRLEKFGINKLPLTKRFSIFTLLLNQFKNPLIYILLVALAISFVTSHNVDAWIILTVVLISTSVGFLQEYKANTALLALGKLITYKAKVFRNGEEIIIPQERVVPGDIILLTAGDRIPADARLFEAQNFEVIEATLTGESIPSNKNIDVLPENTPLADRENMVYFGTVVARGRGQAIVTATGQKTELGHIANLIKETRSEKTPLQNQLDHFGKIIGQLLIVVNIFIFGLGVLTGKPLFEMFLTSVAVVVAAVPEGLLPALTVILAISMQRLTRHKGLVRQMLAAETLGSISVICTDKTGTLTQGEMKISEIITEQTTIYSDGVNFTAIVDPTANASYVTALKIGLLCNNAIIENPEKELKEWTIIGDPTDKALLIAGRSIGFNKEELEKNESRIAEIAFDSEYKLMATLHSLSPAQKIKSQQSNYDHVIYAKGAPENILALASAIDVEGNIITLTENKKIDIQKQYEKLTSSGLRVLAIAYKLQGVINDSEKFNKNNLTDLVFVGLIALKDPLRLEAKGVIQLCQSAGIRPIIITGDHKLTTIAIVQELGIKVTTENVLEGADLNELSDEQLQESVKKNIIFARVEPRHKIRIVSALQANGEIVAMTGDGVNDAPALKKADIGVAIGSGTDVAKETADLVLLDNNFKTIIEAVRRGRITFNNIRKVVLYLLTDAFSEMTIVGGSIILGLPLPILPAQILWIKLIEDAAPAMSLSFDEIDEDVMNELPRKKSEPILNRQFKKLIIFYALIMDLTLFGIFYYFWQTSNDLDYARTITFVGLGLTSLFYIYSVRGLKYSILKLNPFSNKFLTLTTIASTLLMLIAIYLPFLNRILHTVPLGVKEWIVLLSYAMLSIVVYEIGKKITIAKPNNLIIKQ